MDSSEMDIVLRGMARVNAFAEGQHHGKTLGQVLYEVRAAYGGHSDDANRSRWDCSEWRTAGPPVQALFEAMALGLATVVLRRAINAPKDVL